MVNDKDETTRKKTRQPLGKKSQKETANGEGGHRRRARSRGSKLAVVPMAILEKKKKKTCRNTEDVLSETENTSQDSSLSSSAHRHKLPAVIVIHKHKKSVRFATDTDGNVKEDACHVQSYLPYAPRLWWSEAELHQIKTASDSKVDFFLHHNTDAGRHQEWVDAVDIILKQGKTGVVQKAGVVNFWNVMHRHAHLRGLEHWLSSSSVVVQQRDDLVRIHRRGLLHVQDILRLRGTPSHQMTIALAARSRDTSAAHETLAMRRGQHDTREALRAVLSDGGSRNVSGSSTSGERKRSKSGKTQASRTNNTGFLLTDQHKTTQSGNDDDDDTENNNSKETFLVRPISPARERRTMISKGISTSSLRGSSTESHWFLD